MAGAKTPLSVSPGLLKVAERAKRDPEQRILALAHLIDENALARSYARPMRKSVGSPSGRPISCNPIGRPSDENPQGTERAG